MNELTITIEGRAHSGKTTISKIIREALMREGIATTINDEDGMKALMNTNTRLAANSLKARNTAVTINQRTKVMA